VVKHFSVDGIRAPAATWLRRAAATVSALAVYAAVAATFADERTIRVRGRIETDSIWTIQSEDN
jgi:hypothetical protein